MTVDVWRPSSFVSFLLLWDRAGLTSSTNRASFIHAGLCARYAEPHRSFHTVQHVENVLSELAQAGATGPEFGLAAWYHDAVYVRGDPNNEHASAALARDELSGSGATDLLVHRVHDLILATDHSLHPHCRIPSVTPVTLDEAFLMADADLAVLGSSPDTFAAYERGIEAEFAELVSPAYEVRRYACLERLLQQGSIYRHPRFKGLEAQAQHNIKRLMDELWNRMPMDDPWGKTRAGA